MQLHGNTALYVVSDYKLTRMTFTQLVDALRGGMNLADVEIYDDAGEAMTARIAASRRKHEEDGEAPRSSERFEADDSAAPRVPLESCDLSLTSTFGGENTTVEGTLNGYRIKAEGGASDRGTRVVIDGLECWWSGDYSDPLEVLVEDLFDRVCVALVEEYGEDATDSDWQARIVDGDVAVVDLLDSEDDDDDE